MSLFQSIVVKKYIVTQDDRIAAAYAKYVAYFHNPRVQGLLRQIKEEEFQDGFLRKLFVEVLGYTLKPDEGYNLHREVQNETNAQKADGAIYVDGEVVGVIELKDGKTVDLKQVETQAFGYKHHHRKAAYVVISNFEKLRFYIDNAVDYIEFNLFTLTEDEFSMLWLCLAYENIENGLPKRIKSESVSNEREITDELYRDYLRFKRALFDDLVVRNPQYDKLTLFKKSQKLLDRILFICFAEDKFLLPANSLRTLIENWHKFNADPMNDYQSLYTRLSRYFHLLDVGHLPDIYAYNGGLFKSDDVLDNVDVSDEALECHIENLASYDFATKVDVNILGHIFENSLNEIEEITAEITSGIVVTSKRKKDGVFYTPRYITSYIVDNTLGRLCADKRNTMNFAEIEQSVEKIFPKKEVAVIPNQAQKQQRSYSPKSLKKSSTKLTIEQRGIQQKMDERLLEYRSWLLSLTICDPACGSGAFLNAALDFLIAEHKYIDDLTSKIYGFPKAILDVELSILEKNLFGVDINDESVEIAKLSLWLRTAKPNRKLNSLNDNIKCGNSLISDPAVAGDKAFDWATEFPQVFANGGFDVVIGNPPYLVVKGGRWVNGFEYNTSAIDYIKNNFISAEQQINTYILFLELPKYILKDSGIVSQITPNTFFTNEYSQKIRLMLFNDFNLLEIKNCGSVFPDASVETSITTYKKSQYQGQTRMINNDIVTIVDLRDIQVFTDDAKYLINLTKESMSLLSGLEKYSKLNTVAKVWRGLTTGNDNKFISEVPLTDNYKPLITGSDVSRYFKCEVVKYVNYIAEELDRPRDERIFLLDEKLISKFVGNRLSFCFDNSKTYVLNSACVLELKDKKVSLKYLLSLLNSRLLDFYFQMIFSDTRSTFPIMKSGNIESLPICIIPINCQQPFIDLADKMLELNKSLSEKRQKFIKRLSDNFDGLKVTKALEKFNELEFKAFVSELRKQKITLSLKQQDEWDDFFNDHKSSCAVLATQIAITDKEIDQKVYDLYELNPEEIALIENYHNF